MGIADFIRKPGSYTEITTGPSGGLPSKRQRILLVAPRLASGRVAALVPTEVTSAAQAAEAWGAGSVMHRMALALFRQYARATVTGCAVDDAPAGVAASATVTFSGTATATGTVSLWIGADRVQARVDKGAPASVAAADLAAAVNTNFLDSPVTAAASGGALTLTAKNKGTTGAALGQDGKPAVAVEVEGITASATAYLGGQGDPDIAAALAAVAGERYHIIALPWATADAAEALREHIATVSDEINQMGARGFLFSEGNVAEASTYAKAINDKRICVGWIAGAKRPGFENCAAFAAMQSAVESPWLATNNAELIGCDAPPIGARASWNEINNLLWQGVTPFFVSDAGRVACVRAISTYIKNNAGAEDDTFLDSFKIATADYVRDAVRARHLRDFENKILRDNHAEGEPPGVVTPGDVRNTNIDVCLRIEREGGLNNVLAFVDGFISVRDPNSPGRVNSILPIDIVDAAHIMANTLTIVSSL